jgi:hypothetical protein
MKYHLIMGGERSFNEALGENLKLEIACKGGSQNTNKAAGGKS